MFRRHRRVLILEFNYKGPGHPELLCWVQSSPNDGGDRWRQWAGIDYRDRKIRMTFMSYYTVTIGGSLVEPPVPCQVATRPRAIHPERSSATAEDPGWPDWSWLEKPTSHFERLD